MGLIIKLKKGESFTIGSAVIILEGFGTSKARLTVKAPKDTKIIVPWNKNEEKKDR